MSPEGLLLAALCAIGWLWWDGLHKRESALIAARRACQAAGVQLLDETVALRKLGLRRDEARRLRILREFSFEYSAQGDDRQPGRVYLLGRRVLSTSLIVT